MNTETTMTKETQPTYDRVRDLEAFDERKTGVKGLVDEGAENVPTIFVRTPEERSKDFSTCNEKLSVPIIDLAHVNENNDRAKEVIQELLRASEKWGFFQVVNHGISLEILDKMIEATRLFHEQDDAIKKEYYDRDQVRKVKFSTNYDFYKSKAANWRDTLSISTIRTGTLDPHELPLVCRDAMYDYNNQVLKLGDLLLELLSMALGLKRDYLREMQCTQGWDSVCHYYPACPEPDLTLGASEHSDPSFITILLQDHIGGLQVLHQNHQWVNVEPLHGALIVNIGDILQIMSNDKLKSVNHRVVANNVGPRISVPLFVTGLFSSPKIYGPIKELVSEENPPKYKEFTLAEFYTNFGSRPLNQPGIEHFKLTRADSGYQ